MVISDAILKEKSPEFAKMHFAEDDLLWHEIKSRNIQEALQHTENSEKCESGSMNIEKLKVDLQDSISGITEFYPENILNFY